MRAQRPHFYSILAYRLVYKIDKKILIKLLKVLDELKNSIKDTGTLDVDNNEEVLTDIEEGFSIKSPLVGTAYLAPEPGGKKFVEIGKKIKKGDTLMIVEAMKTMNHVPSSKDGIVKKVCVDDGQPVEFGQNLVILE